MRKQSFGVGVERTFPVHSPKIEKIEVAARGDVRRAKLYYLRDRVGKRARVRERRYVGPEESVEPGLLHDRRRRGRGAPTARRGRDADEVVDAGGAADAAGRGPVEVEAAEARRERGAAPRLSRRGRGCRPSAEAEADAEPTPRARRRAADDARRRAGRDEPP